MKKTESSDVNGDAASAALWLLSPAGAELRSLLHSMDEWLSNDDGFMIENVIEWRDQLARVLGKPELE